MFAVLFLELFAWNDTRSNSALERAELIKDSSDFSINRSFYCLFLALNRLDMGLHYFPLTMPILILLLIEYLFQGQ